MPPTPAVTATPAPEANVTETNTATALAPEVKAELLCLLAKYLQKAGEPPQMDQCRHEDVRLYPNPARDCFGLP